MQPRRWNSFSPVAVSFEGRPRGLRPGAESPERLGGRLPNPWIEVVELDYELAHIGLISGEQGVQGRARPPTANQFVRAEEKLEGLLEAEGPEGR